MTRSLGNGVILLENPVAAIGGGSARYKHETICICALEARLNQLCVEKIKISYREGHGWRRRIEINEEG